jgi:hypothetical protein
VEKPYRPNTINRPAFFAVFSAAVLLYLLTPVLFHFKNRDMAKKVKAAAKKTAAKKPAVKKAIAKKRASRQVKKTVKKAVLKKAASKKTVAKKAVVKKVGVKKIAVKPASHTGRKTTTYKKAVSKKPAASPVTEKITLPPVIQMVHDLPPALPPPEHHALLPERGIIPIEVQIEKVVKNEDPIRLFDKHFFKKATAKADPRHNMAISSKPKRSKMPSAKKPLWRK